MYRLFLLSLMGSPLLIFQHGGADKEIIPDGGENRQAKRIFSGIERRWL
ncbi:MAG: hypothetical protein HFI67_11735 [Lachnospiraceae bacterium]|jgi:hypothetical protein|nr:hypothetical protein [Lachnospiraceae bacterium]